jgi:cell division transport system permease protein
VMRALRYFVVEAAASLWRGRRAASMAILTIAAGLFVLGFFLVVNTNLQRIAAHWGETAELAVYLQDEATPEQVEEIRQVVATSGAAASHRYVSKDEAAERFRQDFPDLGATVARLDRNPFPASVDVRLRAEAGADDRAGALVAALEARPGVADVQYDRRWLDRLDGIVRFVRTVGLVIVALLAMAASLTVANVVRLSAHARRDEIEIMQLVGAPFTYVRGPLVLEGVLQGGAGALVAIGALAAVLAAARMQYGALAVDAFGAGAITFLPVELCAILVLGGMLLGCIGGLIVARRVR